MCQTDEPLSLYLYGDDTPARAGILAACTAAAAAGNGIVLLTQPSYSITTQIDLTTTVGDFTILGAGPATTLR